MEASAYSSSSNSSSTSSFYFPTNTITSSSDHQHKPFYSSLHSVRSANHQIKHKQPNHLNRKLHHIAPLPPNPPKVYKVDRLNFKDLVQRLTGASSQQQRRIQNLAPPPLDLLDRQSPPALQQLLPTTTDGSDQLIERLEGSSFSALYRELMTTETTAADASNDNDVMKMMLGPSSYVDNDNYYYNNVTDSVVTASTSFDLNLVSPTSQHCWYSPLFSPAGGSFVSSLDHPQRTIL